MLKRTVSMHQLIYVLSLALNLETPDRYVSVWRCKHHTTWSEADSTDAGSQARFDDSKSGETRQAGFSSSTGVFLSTLPSQQLTEQKKHWKPCEFDPIWLIRTLWNTWQWYYRLMPERVPYQGTHQESKHCSTHGHPLLHTVKGFSLFSDWGTLLFLRFPLSCVVLILNLGPRGLSDRTVMTKGVNLLSTTRHRRVNGCWC